MELNLPPVYRIFCSINKSIIQQINIPEQTESGELQTMGEGKQLHFVFLSDENPPILLTFSKKNLPGDFSRVLIMDRRLLGGDDDIRLAVESGKWLRHPDITDEQIKADELSNQHSIVRNSWLNAFTFREEDVEFGQYGLRKPQLGAVHAVLAHWTNSRERGTIVLPTGTGKTDTMISLLTACRIPKLLVVVPTDPLRTQIAERFSSLGVLKKIGVLEEKAGYPLVGILRHVPKTVEEMEQFIEASQVIVTTMAVISRCKQSVQKLLAERIPYLFVDEAHHACADSWDVLCREFEHRYILQFTATPFRNDQKPLPGKILFRYSIHRSQQEGFFQNIFFDPVMVFQVKQADVCIAEKAIEHLKSDLAEGYDHILLARVENIERAEEVFKIYSKYEEYHPIILHSRTRSKKIREQYLRQLTSGYSRIVVCVDMLGEGFDLPELKIAAFHDVRKSLPVTLQMVGRFTRVRDDLGIPKVIANIGDVNVNEALDRLYAQDADWNLLLAQSSEYYSKDQMKLQKFVSGFHHAPEEFPFDALRPMMNTLIYKTGCDEWTPERYREGIPGLDLMEKVYQDTNQDEHTQIIIMLNKNPVEWTFREDIFTWEWELVFLYWNSETGLLYLHNSGAKKYYPQLAKVVCDGKAELIRGNDIFRCLDRINLLKLQNVGLKNPINPRISYVMRAGSDVGSAIVGAQLRNRIKSNLFGVGYENKSRITIGCSAKGKIWSMKTDHVASLVDWCDSIGEKVMDASIDPNAVLSGTLVPQQVSSRPQIVPVAVSFPDEFYRHPESRYSFIIGKNKEINLHECEIELADLDPMESGSQLENIDLTGPIRFRIKSENETIPFRLEIDANGFSFKLNRQMDVRMKEHGHRVPLMEYFYHHNPTVWFADGSSLEGNFHTRLKKTNPPYKRERIIPWDWSNTNIRKESQGVFRDPESIQYSAIEELKNEPYRFVIDDDDSGESADIVCVRVFDKKVSFDFYHCKYSHGDEPGARVADLYEVCGQAQKSVYWYERPEELIRHILRRSPRVKDGIEYSRFMRGDEQGFFSLINECRRKETEFHINIIQPGLSKQKASTAQLELLSVTENYLMETYMISLTVIASE